MLLYRHFIWLMEKTSSMRRKNCPMYTHTMSADNNTAQINPKGKRIIQAGNEAIAHFGFSITCTDKFSNRRKGRLLLT